MPVPAWQPGTLYLPGAIVVPQTAAQVSTVTLQNPGFESGNGTGWTISGATPSFSKLHPYAGTYTCTFYTSDGGPTVSYEALNNENPSCAKGAVVTATLAVKLATQGIASARAVIVWYNGVGTEIGRAEATLLERPTPNDGNYVISTVNGVAPVGTASCKCGVTGTVGDGGDVRLDAMTLKFQQAGLMYKAVQPAQGTSDSAEPAWPAVLGATVVDNTVTWEAILLSIVTWQASPIAVSGATEPTWPTTPLERVTDGTVAWECFTRAVEDENCPRTKVVAIMSAKVFAADGDIVRFSATANPLDWSAEQDAGYLPTGLQQANANDMAVLAPYRANLVGLNASSFQNWQVDPDPASMALLDQMDGIGSTWHKAAVPVANDLFYLSQLGVRTVGIAAGAENLAAGDVGMPIDSLVQDAIRVAGANNTKALATYYPSAGQYWLAFAQYPAPTLALSGDHPDGEVGVNPGATQYTASGGVLPYSYYTVSAGSLPPGRTLNATTGEVTGTPTLGGTYTWTVRITDADGTVATRDDSAAIATQSVFVSPAVTVGSVLRSEDATTYTTSVATGLAAGISRMYAANGRVFVFPTSGTTGQVTADRGATWADVTGISGNARNGMTYAEHAGVGRYLVFMASGSSAYLSTDGAAFSPVAVESRTYYGAAAKGSIVVAMSTLASLIRSTDGGQTFSAAFSNGVGTVELCLATETYFFAAGGNGLVLRSATGETWTSVLAAGNWQGMAYGQGRLMLLGVNGECRYSDDNGGTWTVGPTIAGFSTGGAGTQNLAYAQGLFIAVGSTQEIYTTPATGTPVWTQRKNEANPPTYEDVVAVRYIP